MEEIRETGQETGRELVAIMRRQAMEEAMELRNRMSRETNQIINKCIGLNSVCDKDDYRQEAFLACYDAELKYDPNHCTKASSNPDVDCNANENDGEPKGKTKMTKKTYGQWFMRKRIPKVAHCDEINYLVHNAKDHSYVKTIRNNEYRKNKRSLEARGFTVESKRAQYNFSDLSSVKDGEIREFVPTETMANAGMW